MNRIRPRTQVLQEPGTRNSRGFSEPRPPRPPVGPQPRCAPPSSPLAPSQPLSRAGPAAAGDGWRRRPKVKGGEPAILGPLCAHGAAPPPPVSPTPSGRARALASDRPRPEKWHFRTLNTPASSPSPKPQRARAWGPCRGGFPGARVGWGCPRIPSSPPLLPLSYRLQTLKGRASLPSSRWPGAGQGPGPR